MSATSNTRKDGIGPGFSHTAFYPRDFFNDSTHLVTSKPSKSHKTPTIATGLQCYTRVIPCVLVACTDVTHMNHDEPNAENVLRQTSSSRGKYRSFTAEISKDPSHLTNNKGQSRQMIQSGKRGLCSFHSHRTGRFLEEQRTPTSRSKASLSGANY